MMICIYYGIRKRMHRESPGSTGFADFCMPARALAMLLVACEQGERLDWWRSGVFIRIARRRRSSYCARCFIGYAVRIHWGVAYLAEVEPVLLDPALLVPVHSLHTIILVPQALAIRGFEPEQIGLRSSGALSHLFPRVHGCTSVAAQI